MKWKKGIILFITALMVTGFFSAAAWAEKKDCRHAWELVSRTDPTCTASGRKVYKCKLCGSKKTETVSALGHDWSFCTVIQSPTCTENGLTRCYCSRDASHVKDETIPALGHKWGEWNTVLSPGLTRSGREERVCERCLTAETRQTAPLIQRRKYDIAWFIFPEDPLVIPVEQFSAEGLTLEWTCAAANTGKKNLWLCSDGISSPDHRTFLAAGEVTLLPLRSIFSPDALASAGENLLETGFRLWGENEAGTHVFESEPISRFVRILSSDSVELPGFSSSFLEIRQNVPTDEEGKNGFLPGEYFRYSVTVSNKGGLALARVELRDSGSGEKTFLENLMPGEIRTVHLQKFVIRKDAVAGYLCWIITGTAFDPEGNVSLPVQSNPLIVQVRAE